MKSESIKVTWKYYRDLDEVEINRWEELHKNNERGGWAYMSPGFVGAINSCVAEVHVLMLWRSKKIVGFMAVQRSAGVYGFLGLYVPAGFPMCDYFGVVAAPGVEIDWKVILKGGDISCLFFTHLDQEQLRIGLTGEKPRVGYRTRLSFNGSACWEWFKQNDKALVKDVERRYRKLEKERGSVCFEMESTNPDAALKSLIEWKSNQYIRTGNAGGILMSERYADVLKYLMNKRSNDAFPVLSTLSCGGKLIAVHFGISASGVLHRWFPAYDPEFSTYSPGKILYKEMLVAAHELGITCIDRGDGDSMAKRDFATEEHFYYKGLVQVGVKGALIALLTKILWRFNIK